MIEIRKFTLIWYQYLINRIYLDLSNYPNNIFYDKIKPRSHITLGGRVSLTISNEEQVLSASSSLVILILIFLPCGSQLFHTVCLYSSLSERQVLHFGKKTAEGHASRGRSAACSSALQVLWTSVTC